MRFTEWGQRTAAIWLAAVALLAPPGAIAQVPGQVAKEVAHFTTTATPPGAGGAQPVSTTTQGAGSGEELVKTCQFFFPRLQFELEENVGDKWNAWPQGDQKLRKAVRSLTNINILEEPVVVNLDRLEEMSRYPFVFMTSEGYFVLPEKHVQNMREYLLRGGFILADDCVIGSTGDHFFKAFLREIKKVFPDNEMKPVPPTHEIFNCFYKLDHTPHLQGQRNPAMGLFDKKTGRLMVLLTSGDIHCGWVGFGNLDAAERQHSIEFGVNIVIYALTH